MSSYQKSKNSKKLIFESKTIMSAGAGAGKTTCLVQHIVENFKCFKDHRKSWPQIVGTTFTKKAALEIKERVSNVQNIKSYGNSLNELVDFAYSESLNIGTIHSICLQLLKPKAYVLGFQGPLKFVTLQNLNFQIKSLAIQISSQKYQNLFEFFNLSQLIKIFKTFEDYKFLKAQPLKLKEFESIIDNKMNELIKKWRSLYNPYKLDSLGTSSGVAKAQQFFKDLNQILLKSRSEKNPIYLKDFFKSSDIRKSNPNFDKLSSQDSLTKNEWEALWVFRDELKESFFKKYDIYYNKELNQTLAKINSQAWNFLKDLQSELLKYKKSESLITLQDIEPLTLELLKNHKSSCQDFIDRWDFWYIDEYQDISEIQKEIFSILIGQKPFFKVGDPQQSIYLFRGAQTEIFFNELDQAKKDPDIKVLRLETNYRSEPHLVFALNELFSHISSQDFQDMKPFSDLNSTSDSETSSVSSICSHSQNLSQTPFNSSLSIYKMNENSEEFDFVVNDILKKIKSGAKPEEFCILSRTRDSLGDYERVLLKKNIPVIKWVSGSYVQRPEIQELCAFVAFFMDPDDNEVLFEILRSPVFQTEPHQITLWIGESLKSKSWSLWDYLLKEKLNLTWLGEESLRKIHQLQKYLNLALESGIYEAIKSIISETEFLYLGKNSLDRQRRQANTYKFLSRLYENHLDENFMESFLKTQSSYSKRASMKEESEAPFKSLEEGVRLMTIHGSKGLEFERVYVVNCSQQGSLTQYKNIELDPESCKFSIPYKNTESNNRIQGPLGKAIVESRIALEKQEALRLIYVAATRAKQELIFIGLKQSKENSIFSYMNLPENPNFNFIKIVEKSDIEKSDIEKSDIEKSENEIIDHPFQTGSGGESLSLSFDENFQRQWNFDDFTNVYQVFKKTSQKKICSTKAFTEPLSVSHLVEIYKKDKNSFSYEVLKKTLIKNNSFYLEKKYFENYNQETSHTSISPLSSYESSLYGNLIHKCFEMFFRGVDRGFIDQRFSHTPLGNLSSTLNLCESFQELKDPPVKELKGSQYPEWGFKAWFEGCFISGQIDLWGQDSKGDIHIFDYKTGSRSSMAHGAVQLGIYAEVLKNKYPSLKVHTHLVQLSDLTVNTLDIQLLRLPLSQGFGTPSSI